jgi:hypothetical protein
MSKQSETRKAIRQEMAKRKRMAKQKARALAKHAGKSVAFPVSE